jgi:hypothetical protein
MDWNVGNASIAQDESQLRTLSIDDRTSIQSLQSSFRASFHNASGLSEHLPASTSDIHERISPIYAWTQIESGDCLNLVTLFRQVNEFETLSNDDRFTLIKYNLFSLFMLHKCLIFDSVNKSFLDTSDEDLDTRHRFVALCPGSDTMKEQFMQWMYSMCQVTSQHCSGL